LRRTEAIIIGGGQAGLAMSRCLSDRAIDHVVLEKGRVAERWRSERWDSLRLLTPNWQSRLPGWRFQGPDPDGYMTMPEVVDFLDDYAQSFAAPLEEGSTVVSVEPAAGGYQVTTDRRVCGAPVVVVATGHCDVPFMPDLGGRLPADILQQVPSRYRNPDQLPDGGVLVVGASSSGVQLADEIHRSGRPVTLAVGRHLRLPRRYRGKDILWWLDALGSFKETVDHVFDVEVSRRQPSLQLVGRPDHGTLDLAVLQAQGVRLAGRAVAVDGSRLLFEDDLVASTVAADAKLAQLLARIDAFAERSGPGEAIGTAEPFVPFWPAAAATPAPTALDLRASGIRTVLWATGYRRRYPWLKVPILDGQGEIRHQGGVTPAPGLYVIGLQFLRRRDSSFIDGVGGDALFLARHIEGHLAGRRTAVA